MTTSSHHHKTSLLFVASLLGLTQTSNGFVVSAPPPTMRLPTVQRHDADDALIFAPPPLADIFTTTTKTRDHSSSSTTTSRTQLMQSLYELKSGQSSRNQQRQALYRDAPLASRLGMPRLKQELERTAFRLLYRRQYEKAWGSTQLRTSMERTLTMVTNQVRDLLDSNAELQAMLLGSSKVTVSARVKEPYSLWRKMLKLGVRNVQDVSDVLALRIVVNHSNNDNDDVLYLIQDLLVQKFRNAHSFKDYVAHPKPNGYQSLHCTFSDHSNNWTFEVQVRSEEMHRVAEHGSAAHWKYKSRDTVTKGRAERRYARHVVLPLAVPVMA